MNAAIQSDADLIDPFALTEAARATRMSPGDVTYKTSGFEFHRNTTRDLWPDDWAILLQGRVKVAARNYGEFASEIESRARTLERHADTASRAGKRSSMAQPK